LDRLFDSQSHAIDTNVLLFATAQALSHTRLFPVLDEAAKKLKAILRLRLAPLDERDLALDATNELREALADATDFAQDIRSE
jgi:hypothetical protein